MSKYRCQSDEPSTPDLEFEPHDLQLDRRARERLDETADAISHVADGITDRARLVDHECHGATASG